MSRKLAALKIMSRIRTRPFLSPSVLGLISVSIEKTDKTLFFVIKDRILIDKNNIYLRIGFEGMLNICLIECDVILNIFKNIYFTKSV